MAFFYLAESFGFSKNVSVNTHKKSLNSPEVPSLKMTLRASNTLVSEVTSFKELQTGPSPPTPHLNDLISFCQGPSNRHGTEKDTVFCMENTTRTNNGKKQNKKKKTI